MFSTFSAASSAYWTASPSAGDAMQDWYAHFGSGLVAPNISKTPSTGGTLANSSPAPSPVTARPITRIDQGLDHDQDDHHVEHRGHARTDQPEQAVPGQPVYATPAAPRGRRLLASDSQAAARLPGIAHLRHPGARPSQPVSLSS